MKKRNTFKKRVLSIILCLALILSYIPFSLTAAAAPADDASSYSREVDDNTMDNWTKYFDINKLNTVNAGGVWTDKSVFKDTSSFPSSITMLDSNRNFLTALSSIAANKEIVGYSSVPTDTVLVLDLSNSMPQSARSQLITAANNAIKKLHEINNNNRVGIVLYSGDTSPRTYEKAVTRLMPIDRYTSTRNDGNFINYSGGNVSVYTQNVSGTKQNTTFGNKAFEGATYIQAGLWEAYEMFSEIAANNDTIIGDNNWQSGEARMPIVVLMSDGAPTLGASDFADVKNQTYGNNNALGADVGDGSSSGVKVGQGFLVQLTASYIKNRIENLYKVKDENGAGRSLFYTLGFNLTTISNQTAKNIASGVLNPDGSTLTDSLWSTYNNPNTTNMSVQVEGRNGGDSTVTITKNSYATSKSYVDEYFSASDGGLTDAFDSIVEEIILQSRYYPTHLAGGNPDFSGYLEFTDTLGEYMEVKHINGILLGDTLYDGHMMASKLADNSESGLGTPDAPTELGNEFIRAVKTRLGITDTADAQILVSKAFADKQLYYTDKNNWSNYIAWYAKSDGTYAGFYDEDGTEPKPSSAVYINRSYGFLGETAGSIKNSDMMYMSVQIRTNIATGEQTVLWKIPASLVPMVTYKVTLKGNNVDNATDVKLTLDDENVSPIRLVYETGLRSDLNAFNITRITGTAINSEVKNDEGHIAADGHTRLFWNNAFDISADDHEHHKTAIAEFTPNKENERFYYTFDSAVHKYDGTRYVLVGKDETLNPNGEYYHRRYTFNENSTLPIFTYEKMSKASIEAAEWNDTFKTLDNQTGAWVVKKGTPARELTMYDEEKTTNRTTSAHMVFYPYLTEQNNTHYVDMNLGNNGRLAITPKQGIKLSKTIDVYENDTSNEFSFLVTVHNENGTPYTSTADTYITDLDQTPESSATQVTFSAQGTRTFSLSADKTLWITGLPTGCTYTIEELKTNSDYKVKSVHVNQISTGTTASGTIAAYYIDDVDFVNTAIGEGDLVITKQVIDASGNTVDINDSVLFNFDVLLTNSSNQPISGTFDSNKGRVPISPNGMFNLSLKEGESFTLKGLPEQTKYTVFETNIPTGFSLNSEKSSLTGVIDASANDQALIVNNYEPTSTNGQGVNVKVVKEISGKRTSWLAGESYTFNLVRLDNPDRVVDTATISDSDTQKEHVFSLANETYSAAGTYHYAITEQVGTQGGITYDTADRRFSVTVADSDNNGTLEIVDVKNEINTTVSGNWLVTSSFNNVYAPVGSASATINIKKTMIGSHALSGYSFALYNTNPKEDTNTTAFITSPLTNAAGETSISLTYSADDAGQTYTYYLAEVGFGNTINNIKYDDTVYPVEVTITDNLNGTISAQVLVKNLPTGVSVPTFENEYVPSASDYISFSGKKVINGDRVLNANEFTFKLNAITSNAPMPTTTEVKNAADGSFAFSEIEFKDKHKGNSYVYTITEVDTNKIGGFTYDATVYTITVTVADNGNQTITASAVVNNGSQDVDDIVFTNTYDAEDAKVIITGEKMLTGKTMQNGEFSFTLEPVTVNAPMPTSPTVSNDENGKITFGEIIYSKAGTYIYTLKEVNGGDPRYDYDTSVYTVTVIVTDNSIGKLSARVELSKNSIPSEEIVFVNGFVPTPITYNIHTDFGGKKVLDGRPLVEGEFEFALINAINGIQIGDTVKNDANGEFRFPAVYIDTVGIYHFKLVEISGNEKGVSYDDSSYHIRLEVKQNAAGELYIDNKKLFKGTVAKQDVGGVLTEVTSYEDITTQGQITFNNTYKADPAYVTLEAKKVLIGRDLKDGEFKFDLYKTDSTFNIQNIEPVQNNVVLALNDDGNGDIIFMPEAFDTEGTYYYAIVEDELNQNGITSDDTVYKIEIVVTDNHKGDLVASVKVNGNVVDGSTADIVAFKNHYKAEPTEIVIDGLKTLQGRDLVESEFSFELYNSNNEILQTTQNAEDGEFKFAAIPVDAEGEYIYTVKETKGEDEQITYDETVYTVKVVVTDNLKGTFDVDYTYLMGEEVVEALTFNNLYTAPIPSPEPELNPTPDFEDKPTPKPTPEPSPQDEIETTPKPIDKPENESPKTGDCTNIWLWFAVAFLSGSFALGSVLPRKSKKAEENK